MRLSLATTAALMFLVATGAQAQVESSRLVKVRSDAGAIAQAISRMKTDTGTSAAACLTKPKLLASGTPPKECGRNLQVCRLADPGALCWGGPYLSGLPRDPWGNEYVVKVDPGSGHVTVTSKGPDGRAGTADDLTF